MTLLRQLPGISAAEIKALDARKITSSDNLWEWLARVGLPDLRTATGLEPERLVDILTAAALHEKDRRNRGGQVLVQLVIVFDVLLVVAIALLVFFRRLPLSPPALITLLVGLVALMLLIAYLVIQEQNRPAAGIVAPAAVLLTVRRPGDPLTAADVGRRMAPLEHGQVKPSELKDLLARQAPVWLRRAMAPNQPLHYADLEREQVCAARTIPVHGLLTAADLALQRSLFDPSAFSSPSPLLERPRRTPLALQKGQVILRPMLEEVTVVAQTDLAPFRPLEAGDLQLSGGKAASDQYNRPRELFNRYLLRPIAAGEAVRRSDVSDYALNEADLGDMAGRSVFTVLVPSLPPVQPGLRVELLFAPLDKSLFIPLVLPDSLILDCQAAGAERQSVTVAARVSHATLATVMGRSQCFVILQATT